MGEKHSWGRGAMKPLQKSIEPSFSAALVQTHSPKGSLALLSFTSQDCAENLQSILFNFQPLLEK